MGYKEVGRGKESSRKYIRSASCSRPAGSGHNCQVVHLDMFGSPRRCTNPAAKFDTIFDGARQQTPEKIKSSLKRHTKMRLYSAR